MLLFYCSRIYGVAGNLKVTRNSAKYATYFFEWEILLLLRRNQRRATRDRAELSYRMMLVSVDRLLESPASRRFFSSSP